MLSYESYQPFLMARHEQWIYSLMQKNLANGYRGKKKKGNKIELMYKTHITTLGIEVLPVDVT